MQTLRTDIDDLRAMLDLLEQRKVSRLAMSRLSIVDRNGVVRLRLFDDAHTPPPEFNGEFFVLGPRTGAGLMYATQEGTECGGVMQAGDATFMTFDRFRRDQVIQLSCSEGGGGLLVNDQVLEMEPYVAKYVKARRSRIPLRWLRLIRFGAPLLIGSMRGALGGTRFSVELAKGDVTVSLRGRRRKAPIRAAVAADGSVQAESLVTITGGR